MNTLLNEAKKKFKNGDLFLSATKAVKSPLRVGTLLVAENYPETIINSEGGVIVFTEESFDEEGNSTSKKVWAEKVTKNKK